MSDDLVRMARASASPPHYIDTVKGIVQPLTHVLADQIEAQTAEIARLSAELATARREGMKRAAKLLEELHKNHGYDAKTGEVRRRGELVTCPLTIDHTMGYYRAIAEGVAHILRAAEKEGK